MDPRAIEFGRGIKGDNYREWADNFHAVRAGKSMPSQAQLEEIWSATHKLPHTPADDAPALKTSISMREPDGSEAGTPEAPDGGTPDGGTLDPSVAGGTVNAPAKQEVPDAGPPMEPTRKLAHYSGIALNGLMGAAGGVGLGAALGGLPAVPMGVAGAIANAKVAPNIGDAAYHGFVDGDPQAKREAIMQAVGLLAGGAASTVSGPGMTAASKILPAAGSTAARLGAGLATSAATTTGGGALYDYMSGTHTPEGQAGADAAQGIGQYAISAGLSGLRGVGAGSGFGAGIKGFAEQSKIPMKDNSPATAQDMELFNQLSPENQGSLRTAVGETGAVFPTQYPENANVRKTGLDMLNQRLHAEAGTSMQAKQDLATPMETPPAAPARTPLPDLHLRQPFTGQVPPPYEPRVFPKTAVPRPAPQDPIASPQQAPFVPKPIPTIPAAEPPVSPYASLPQKWTFGGPDMPIGENTVVPPGAQGAAAKLQGSQAVQDYLLNKDYVKTNDIRNKGNYVEDQNAADALAAEEKARFTSQSDAAKQGKTSAVRDYVENKNAADQSSVDTQRQNFDKTQQDLVARRQAQIDTAKQQQDYHNKRQNQLYSQSVNNSLTVDDENNANAAAYQKLVDAMQGRNLDLADRQGAAPNVIADADKQHRLLSGLTAAGGETPDLNVSRMASGPINVLLRNLKLPNSTLLGLRPETPVRMDALRSGRALGVIPYPDMAKFSQDDYGGQAAGSLLRHYVEGTGPFAPKQEAKNGRQQ